MVHLAAELQVKVLYTWTDVSMNLKTFYNDFLMNSNEAAIPTITTVNEFKLYLTEENENVESLHKYLAFNKAPRAPSGFLQS